MSRSARLFAALLLVVGLVAVPTAPAQAVPGFTAAFSAADNGSWWQAKFVLSNRSGAAVTGWTLEFDLAPGVTMGGTYYGKATQSGNHVTITNEHYNATVAEQRHVRAVEPVVHPVRIGGRAAQLPAQRRQVRRLAGHSALGARRTCASPAKTTKSVSLAWNASTAGTFPVASYDVYRGATLATNVTGTTATVTGLTPNTAYSFTVRAKDTRGNASPPSAALSVTTNNPAERHPTAERARQPALDRQDVGHRLARVERVDGQHRHRRLRRVPGLHAGHDGHRHDGDRHRAHAVDRVQLHRPGQGPVRQPVRDRATP